ncbi:hypothetical protein [Streptomyces sp. NBC_00328]|uniref:hypothetical protein n=1 Tax=Streptomyces sp. NBC_00328 TaxID=2903646 RepID=UPI002E2A4698|nr:hypothetical protein [Streptomyces sp. NBC_00328]
MTHRAVVRREDLEGVQAVGVVAGGADVGRQGGLAVRRGGAQAPVRAAHREDAGASPCRATWVLVRDPADATWAVTSYHNAAV